MIQLTLELDDLDYDALVDQFLPVLTEQLRASGNPLGALLSNGMPASMAKGILHGLSQEKKERLATDLINGNKARFISMIQEMAAKREIRISVRDLQAKQN